MHLGRHGAATDGITEGRRVVNKRGWGSGGHENRIPSCHWLYVNKMESHEVRVGSNGCKHATAQTLPHGRVATNSPPYLRRGRVAALSIPHGLTSSGCGFIIGSTASKYGASSGAWPSPPAASRSWPLQRFFRVFFSASRPSYSRSAWTESWDEENH